MTPRHAAFHDLTGQLLIAMPDLGDPRFQGSVVFLCSHSTEGAMGLIVNKPLPEVRLDQMLGQLGIAKGADAPDVTVCYGGPVATGRGFVLHSADYRGSGNERLSVNERFAMTATLDILRDIAVANGPRQALMALGYAGWGPGQLEAEIGQNSWLTTEATADLVFACAMERKWAAALDTLGVSPLTLSAQSGRA